MVIFLSLKSFSQDSVKITISPQARDLEYISSFIFNDFEGQELFDSCKVKFRVVIPPTGNTSVSITAYTMDWYTTFLRLKNDPTALKANCTSRIEALLRAINQTYLNSKLDLLDIADTNTFQAMRQFGRDRLRRKSN
jgi:hypothetical protein